MLCCVFGYNTGTQPAARYFHLGNENVKELHNAAHFSPLKSGDLLTDTHTPLHTHTQFDITEKANNNNNNLTCRVLAAYELKPI